MRALAEQLALEEKSLRDRVDALGKESDRLQSNVDRLRAERSALESQPPPSATPSSGLTLPVPSAQRPLSAQGKSVRHVGDTSRGLKRSDLPQQPVAPAPQPSNGEPNPNVPLTRKVGFW